MATVEQKKKLLKAKIAIALQDELGRVPTKEEIERTDITARVLYKATHTTSCPTQMQSLALVAVMSSHAETRAWLPKRFHCLKQ